MLRLTCRRMASLSSYIGVEIEPYTTKSLFIFSFIASIAFLSSYAMRETKKAGPLKVSSTMEMQRMRQSDPRRPPWPLLHQRVVLLREGKGNPADIPLLWEQTKHYYPADWLIPLELTQVLKHSTAAYLQNYVADPAEMQKEILTQLLNVKYGRVNDVSASRINRDVAEIISVAIDDLESMNLSVTEEVPLVPTRA